MPEDEDLERQEVEAFLETRRELGPAYEREIVDAFAERVEAAVQARVASELAQQGGRDTVDDRQGGRQLALGIVSVVMGVPTTAIAVGAGSEAAQPFNVAIVWAGIVAVNWAHAWRARLTAGRSAR